MNRVITRRAALGRVATGLGLASVFQGQTTEANGAQRVTPATPQRRTTANTVLGPIDTSKLGFTLSHEHIIASSAGLWHAWPELFGGQRHFIDTAVVLRTTIDLGRDIRMMEEVS